MRFVGSGLIVFLVVLCSPALAQPVITDVTAVDVTFSTIGQGVDGIAQGGIAQVWGEGVAKDLGSKVLVNGVETLSVAESTGQVFFRVPPATPLGPATVAVEVDGVMSAQVAFTVSAFAPTGFESGDDLHLDGTEVDEDNPAAPGETIRSTGLTGFGADPSPVVTATLGGLPLQIVSLVEGVGDFPFPGVYEATYVVPEGIGPGFQAGTLTVGGFTWGPPNNEGWELFIGGGGGEVPSIAEGGIVLATGLPQVSTVSALSIITVWGSNFSTEAILNPTLDENGDLDTTLGGVCVEIGGERSPIYAVTPNQINVQTPATPTLGPVSVVVITGCDTAAQALNPATNIQALSPVGRAIRSEVAMVTVEEATPGFFLFTLADGGLIAARFNATPSQAPVPVAPADLFPNDDFGPSRPAMPGDILLLYGTGWGPTTADLGTGELAPDAAQVLPEASPMVTFGGVPMAPEDVLYVGVTPDAAGLFQLAIRVPAGAVPGNNRVVLTVYSKSTPDGPVIPVGSP
jgi:uncharacterized protein (TIGR03437 family)